MDITVAYFHPLLHPGTVKHDFEQLRAAGASSIVYAIHEHEEQRGIRDLQRGLQQAQDAGLKVYLSLGRYGNLFAGPSSLSSWYTFQHPETRVMDRHGRYHDFTCFNHESFRSWLFKEIAHYVAAYPINGLILEEPRGPDITCFCSVCRALCPDITDLSSFRKRSMMDFLGELFLTVKKADHHLRTSIVLLPQDLSLLDDLANLPSLDVLGAHLFWNALHEKVDQVGIWGERVVEAATRSQKVSQLWLQNFSLNEAAEAQLEPAFEQIISTRPDEIASYYYWRNNENPERVWQQTVRLLRRVPRRQLFWQKSAFVPVKPVV